MPTRPTVRDSATLCSATVEDTWTDRDLPVLDAVVRLLDQGNFLVTVRDIAGETGLEPETVDRALEALEGPYVVEYEQFATGGDPSSWRVRKVTAAARQAVGQWPTAEGLITRLTEALSDAAEHEPDPEQKSRLRAIASSLGGSARQIAIDVAARIVERQTGLG